jgi:hypothetical protein
MIAADAVEMGAKAWFDRIQAERLDADRRRPDGQLWQWEDLAESDRVAYRALVRPVVAAALQVAHEMRASIHKRVSDYADSIPDGQINGARVATELDGLLNWIASDA